MLWTVKAPLVALSIALASCLLIARGDADAAPIPLAALTPSAEILTGRVDERLPAGGYTYLNIRGDDDTTRWLVVMGSAPKIGATITARSMGKRADFRSARLARTFAELHFASLTSSRSP